MNFIIPLAGILFLVLIAWLSSMCEGLRFFIACVFPYVAGMLLIAGTAYRIAKWGWSPVPFRIPTTSGQQRSLPWLKTNSFENPHNRAGVIGRMMLEVLLFRSLFRNTKVELAQGPHLAYASSKFLWIGGLVFHWSLLIIVIRHLRFFAEPAPMFASLLQSIDGIFEIGAPSLFLTDALICIALIFLVLRRFSNPLVRYISLIADFAPLLLIASIVATGILMRHFMKVDLFVVKKYALNLLSFSPAVPEGIGVIFYLHLFLVCILAAYMPFSKLIHFSGIFLSPTRAMANSNRIRRHVNPWDYPVKVHTYEEWESEFRDKLKSAGYKLEKE